MNKVSSLTEECDHIPGNYHGTSRSGAYEFYQCVKCKEEFLIRVQENENGQRQTGQLNSSSTVVEAS